MRTERCETCRYFNPDKSSCHRYPPNVVVVYPREAEMQCAPTTKDNWCGEWKKEE